MTTAPKKMRWRWLTVAAMCVAALSAGSARAESNKATAPNAKLDVAALTQLIDRDVHKTLDAAKVKPSPLADDSEFLRRVYLDITGVIPPADKVAAFLDSKDPQKRAKVIDELLASPHFGRHMADIWQAMLLPRVSDNRRIQTEPFIKWLEKNFNDNKAWDQFVSELLTATGSQEENSATTFYLANRSLDKVADTVSRTFLGVQLQCAQCHNHPFTGWKQTEYWGMAAFFMKVKADAPRNNQPGPVGVSEVAAQGARPRANGGLLMRPEATKVVPAKFLGGAEPKIDAADPARPVLAKWLTATDNPYFARAMVNRMWAQFFGKGFVNPIDDMHDANTPANPELFKELTQQFKANGHDLKFLIRTICNSQTYQRSSKPFAGNDEADVLFSFMTVKVMTPEQLFDSLETVIGKMPARPGTQRGGVRTTGGARANFVAFFQGDEGADPTEFQSGIPQALRLMNSGEVSNNAALLTQAVKSGKNPTQVVEHLYLGTVTRHPTQAESSRLLQYVAKHGDKAYGDILWALLNSSEFTLNH